MCVRIEFFGIPRLRARIAAVELDVQLQGTTLRDVLCQLEQRFPDLAQDCIRQGQMCDGCVANLDGQQFVSDPTLRVQRGQSILIMSADVGG